MPSTTTHAFKEWDVAVDALEQGKTIMLLRKGGIHERGGRFQVAHERVLLYPTHEHQQPFLLKPEYAPLVTPVISGWHPQTIRIGSFASVTDIFSVTDETTVNALLAFHIWNEQFISDRLKWKPLQPLYILLLRTYKLAQVQIIPYNSIYGGCKSWIDLAEPIAIDDSVAVLNDATYNHMAAEISAIVANKNNFYISSLQQ